MVGLRRRRPAAAAGRAVVVLAPTRRASSAGGRSRDPASRAPNAAPPASRGVPVGGERRLFSPRPAAVSVRAGATAGGEVGGSWNQVRQQKLNAQQSKLQWRRMARSERTMKSAQPNSCFTCWEPCSTQVRRPYRRTPSARSAGAGPSSVASGEPGRGRLVGGQLPRAHRRAGDGIGGGHHPSHPSLGTIAAEAQVGRPPGLGVPIPAGARDGRPFAGLGWPPPAHRPRGSLRRRRGYRPPGHSSTNPSRRRGISSLACGRNPTMRDS